MAEPSPPDEIGVAEATEPHQPVPVRYPGRSPDDEAIVDAINEKMVRYRKEKAPGKKWTALQDEAVANGLEFDAESGKYREAPRLMKPAGHCIERVAARCAPRAVPRRCIPKPGSTSVGP